MVLFFCCSDSKEAIQPESEVNEFCLLGEMAHLRLAVHLTVCAGAFKVQLVVEDEASPTQTGPV